MSEIMPFSGGQSGSLNTTGGRLSRRASNGLTAIESETLMRFARVTGESLVQAEKLHQLVSLVGAAMTGQKYLSLLASCLSRGDPLLADDLRFYEELAKMGQGQIIQDTENRFRRI